jgi:hypothetical protein
VKKLMTLAIAFLFILAFCAAVAGCGGSAPERTGETNEEEAETSQAGQTEGVTVTMNGRSVMGGWLQSWGFDWSGPVKKNGYTFDYKELNADDLEGLSMAESFAENVEGLAPGSIVFFKFCFADFNGSNLATLEKNVDAVVKTAKDKGFKLIIGNALPVSGKDGTPELKDEYAKYNAFLEKTAKENPNVWIYDFYGVLAGPDGFLLSGYDTGDGHPNDAGYAELDKTFFPMLESIRGQ